MLLMARSLCCKFPPVVKEGGRRETVFLEAIEELMAEAMVEL